MKPKYILIGIFLLFLLLRRARGGGGFTLFPRGGNAEKPTNAEELNKTLESIQNQTQGGGDAMTEIYVKGANLHIPAGNYVNQVVKTTTNGQVNEQSKAGVLSADLIEPIQKILTAPGAAGFIAQVPEYVFPVIDVLPGGAGGETNYKVETFVAVPNDKLQTWVKWI